MDERTVMSADDVGRAIERLARDVVERHGGTDGLVLIGIQRRGAILAHRIAAGIAAGIATATATATDHRLPVGTLDISLYRDDLTELATYPIVRPTELPVDISGTTVVLIDDVLFTGRTVRAALDALTDHGRPRLVRLAVLVDRGHRELPVRADHVGRNLPTSRDERVNVHVVELDGADQVTLGRVIQPARTVPGVAGAGGPGPG